MISQKSELNDVYDDRVSHYHITVGVKSFDELQELSKIISGKPTPVYYIINGEVKYDWIITKHQKGISILPMLMDVKKLTSTTKILRYKLELNINDVSYDLSNIQINNINYLEYHLKVSKDIDIDTFFVKSYNSQKDDFYYLNYRSRSIMDNIIFDVELKSIKDKYNLQNISLHKEFVLFDSDPNHDSKWA